MNEELMATGEPVVISSQVGDELGLNTVAEVEAAAEENTVSSGDVVVELPEDMLTNEVYMDGISQLVSTIDTESVHEEVFYEDRGVLYNLGSALPDYAVVYLCNDIEVVFPTDYAENIIISDGMLVNLGSSYTAGLQIDGYSVDNYLSSEITIPTYHSATWYQYLQSYGQPYRIVDRYVNNYGSISSSTRSSVAVEWSGGNPWEGFTFDKAAMFITICILAFMLVFRKGK